MLVSEVIEKLTELKNKYGDVEVLEFHEDPIWGIIPKKYIKTGENCNDAVTIHVEDLDENYLEKYYKGNGIYADYFLSEGICIKIY